MFPEYPDIQALTDKEPIWYDDHGVPRYAPFSPRLLSTVYAHQCALMEVQCQSCNRTFLVGIDLEHRRGQPSTAQIITEEALPHYGDAPFHGAGGHPQCGGTTMCAITTKVLQLWGRNAQTGHDWQMVMQYKGGSPNDQH